MLSEPMENNTFQSQSARNQWNNKYVNLPGYRRRTFCFYLSNFVCLKQKKISDGHQHFFVGGLMVKRLAGGNPEV